MGAFFEPGFNQDFEAIDFPEAGFSQDFSASTAVAASTAGSMANIAFSSSDSGPANFNFTYNPFVYRQIGEQNNSIEVPILHGSSIWNNRAKDSRFRVMTWRNNPVDEVGISNMVTYFKSIVGKSRYINFGVIEPLNNDWLPGTTWKNCRIIKLEQRFKDGGLFNYADLNLFIVPI